MLAQLWFANPLGAQVITGTIQGRITDPSGALVPGAAVTVTNQETNIKLSYVTDENGLYVASLLPIATYTVTASKTGFRTSSSRDIRISAGSGIRLDLRLELGEVSDTVEVTGTAAQLQTDSAQIATPIGGRTIRDLPIVGRDMLRLATLGPGVVQKQTSGIHLLTDDYLGNNIPTIAGGRAESASFTLGGINVNNRRLNMPMEKPSLDAIEEFKVLANNYTAEYGQGDGQIIVEFRSGTNNLHGSVYEFLRNDALDARGFFDVSKPPVRYNQFGTAVGGPIWKNRTFFFANYEGIRNPASVTQAGLFPTTSMLGGDFSNLRNSAGEVIPIFDPATTDPVTGRRTQFPGNVVPSNRISSVAKSLYGLYGAPAPPSLAPGAANNILAAVPRTFTVDQLSFKVDHHFARGDTLSTRYSISDPRRFSGNITTASESTGSARNQIIGQTWTHIFGPTLVNEIRGGYVRQRNVNFPPVAADQDLQKAAGFPNPLPFNFIPTVFMTSSTGTVSFNQLNSVSAGGGGEAQQTYQLVDNLSWIRGKHTLKFGTDLRRRRWDTLGTNPSGGGSLRNSGLFTSQLQADPAVPGNFVPVLGSGSALADFMLGQLTGVDFGVGQNHFRYRDTLAAFFGQDTWHITPRLTVMLGLRWDYQSPIMEKGGRQSWYNTDSRCPDGCLINDGTFGGAKDPIINPFPGQEAIRPGGINPDRNNFGPRFSVAYRLRENTVVRAGYGVFFSVYGQNNFPGATNPPFGSGYLINSAIETTSNPLDRLMKSAFPLDTLYPLYLVKPPGQTLPGVLGLGFYFDTDNVQPSLIDTSFTIQHSFTPTVSGEIGYFGKFGRNLTGFNNVNPCTTTPCTQDPITRVNIRTYRNFGSVALVQTDNTTSYNAGYLKLEKRFSDGLSFLGSWTWSRSLVTGGDSEGNDIFLGSSGGLFDYRFRPKHLSVLDATHRLVVSGIYELPFGRNKRFAPSVSGALDRLVGGWQVGWITAFQSGTAVDLSSFNGARFKPGQGPNLKRLDFRKTGFFFDTSLFQLPNEGGVPGDPIPYTNFRGAGINNWDLSVFKNIQIVENHRLQFRAEFWNAWNHGQFEVPGHVINVPGFGRFQARNPSYLEFGARPPRNIQLGLRYEF